MQRDDDDDDEPIETLDTETLAILNKAKQEVSLKSPEMEAQSPGHHPFSRTKMRNRKLRL